MNIFWSILEVPCRIAINIYFCSLEVQEKLTGKYTLNIKCEEATYNLKYPGTQSILKVKGDVYTLTSIHVRNQIWSGWPPNIDDQTMLALSGIK
jgi:hypothetical protein